ncbi:MAG: hybrid sensor histidine kinase/response regulator [Tannerella sp.]|jgi:signal transduction histidine kinase/CheY-like chemotaxis protein|nr:hybrid sensor histidine kinase/response regulator [Tannerella sp.]
MKKRSIETSIRVNVLLICVLIGLICSGVLFYFYATSKNIDLKKKTVGEYNRELTQINDLLYAVNEAQADVNLFVITQNKRHLQQYQTHAKAINQRIDSLKTNQPDFGIDTVLTEITQLLKHKEQSIILLNRQFTNRSPIDSLSRKLATLTTIQHEETDTLSSTVTTAETENELPSKDLWQKITDLFSFSKTEASVPAEIVPPVSVGADISAENDTLEIDRIIAQTRTDYDQHMSAIEKQINSVVMADQFITTRITNLLTRLYSRVVNARIDEVNRDEALLRKNNSYALVAGSVALLLIIISIILILNNVKKGHSARIALEKANKRAKWLMESRHKMLLSVSHDVKTPLNSILGYVDLYHRKGILTTPEVTPVRNSGNHILSLLSNLLEFSSLEKGSVELIPSNFSLRELCSEVCDMFIPLAKKKSLRFDYQSDFSSGLILYSDGLKIKQILINILSNAIKYTVEGGITFEAGYRENKLQFRITDTGIGIPADKTALLYKPFSRIRENGTGEEGSGFGLFVVKGLVDLFKGKISFRSKPDKGTQVTVELSAEKGKNQSAEAFTGKILIVEDDDLYLELLSDYCRRLGHAVTACANCGEFVQELGNIHSFNCVLTDMEMGDFTGSYVLAQIRERNKEIPVILVTGRGDLSKAGIHSEGFADVLVKPVTPGSLYALIGGKMPAEKENSLTGFLGQDRDAMVEIMQHFFISTVDHVIQLKEAVSEQDFDRAQYLCHKMLPMFLQTGTPESVTSVLKYVDTLRGTKEPDTDVWEKLNALPGQIEQFLQQIQADYLS